MSTQTASPGTRRETDLRGQTVVVIGGSAGIGLETARQARAEGAQVILAARNPERLKQAAAEVGAERTAAFDATDWASLSRFFDGLPEKIDHVMVTGPGPHYARLADLDREQAQRDFAAPSVAGRSCSTARGRPGAGGWHAAVHGRHRRPQPRTRPVPHSGSHRRHACADRQSGRRGGADQSQPDRGRLVDTPLSASLLGDDLDARRDQLRKTLPIQRVVGPADIAALAVHLMTNTALTGATYDIDGGQQLVPSR